MTPTAEEGPIYEEASSFDDLEDSPNLGQDSDLASRLPIERLTVSEANWFFLKDSFNGFRDPRSKFA